MTAHRIVNLVDALTEGLEIATSLWGVLATCIDFFPEDLTYDEPLDTEDITTKELPRDLARLPDMQRQSKLRYWAAITPWWSGSLTALMHHEC